MHNTPPRVGSSGLHPYLAPLRSLSLWEYTFSTSSLSEAIKDWGLLSGTCYWKSVASTRPAPLSSSNGRYEAPENTRLVEPALVVTYLRER